MPMTRRDALALSASAAAVLAAPGTFAQTSTLIQKPIPKSGELLPPVGIGTNRFGVEDSEAELAPLRATLARFVELGGKVIDTAYIYGRSEAVIGDLVAELGIRDRLFISTKTDIRGQIRGATGLQGSSDRLRTDIIDTMLVHNFANVDSELPLLREWKQAGRIRYIGASTSTADQHAQMERFMLTEDVDVVQFNYSLGDRAAADRLLPIAADRGIAVMINIPFAGARNSLFNVVEGHALPEWAADFGCTSWGQFFLKYIISHPAVTVAIPGTRQVRHVDDNFGAAMGRLPDASERRRQEQFFDALT
jgi:aryl-alcohol dehydrogenase-like predicted oxidoreductase